MRDGKELTMINQKYITPQTTEGFNPAFDVTDHSFITGIACERGVFPPEEIKTLV